MRKIDNNVEDKQIDDTKPVKKPVDKAEKKSTRKSVGMVVEKVVEAAEKVEKEIKEKRVGNSSQTKKQIETQTKLYKSVMSKKNLFIEHYGKQISEEMIIDKLVLKLEEAQFKGVIKNLNIYYKAEEEIAYCVVNQGEPIVLKVFD
jgi:hypothetical protein